MILEPSLSFFGSLGHVPPLAGPGSRCICVSLPDTARNTAFVHRTLDDGDYNDTYISLNPKSPLARGRAKPTCK